MSHEEQDVRAALAEALQAADPEAAWYFDRVARRVVTVRAGETDVPELDAEDVEEDEERYVAVPALTEAELHAWMVEFVLGREPELDGLLDARKGANRRFLAALGARHPQALADWRAHLEVRVLACVDAWLRDVE
jgi:hypothetical protein